ncbi:MAG: preprotein translocase subunit Tim44 [Thalassobium sp.]|uniref:Tim44-like domain-containing protein n=1 Tax=hydrothermal vent metagenome TaxID=652676 RepID=A0A160TAX5_9ZZZZ|nr:MAG: preprotein translocase subunit Tim44 [Thalassobium sp.]PHQ87664.1 MAG: preprotein translocase subunit Tim44 [Thalassobium sp.]
MKTFLTVFSAFIFLISVSGEAQAKRFGGGGFGKTYSTPYKSAQPAKPSSQPASNQPGRKGGLMGGMLGGLLAGGLFAYLLGSGAFEGIQLMDILLLAGAFFVIMRLLKGIRGPQPAHAGHAHARQSFDQTPNTNSTSSFQGNGHQAPLDLPENFDVRGFIDGSLEHYRSVQQAWNDGNLDLIREYVAADLYAALAAQRNRLMVPPKTEVLDLEAEIVRAEESDGVRHISILFKGRCRDELEKSEDGIFDIWHLERDLSSDNSPWLVVGIEAQ